MFKTYTPRHNTASLSFTAQAAHRDVFAMRRAIQDLKSQIVAETEPYKRVMLEEQLARIQGH